MNLSCLIKRIVLKRPGLASQKYGMANFHDSAANVTNSAFYYSNRVTTSGTITMKPRPNKNTQSFCDPIHNKNNIICCALSIGKTEK